jgi:nucleotide-binding universal stress UspA family protein
MPGVILLCTDGSDLAERALRTGLDLLGRTGEIVLVTSVSPPDPSLLVGTGFAGGTVMPEEYDAMHAEVEAEGARIIGHTIEALGLGEDVRTKVLTGEAASAVCDYAQEIGAAAIVLGTRGRSGFKRALLGSVSDYVVRHAPCPVVVTNVNEGDES